MSDSSLQPFGYGTEKENKSKQAVLWDTVSTLPNVSTSPHFSPETFLPQTADEVLGGFPTVSQQAGMDWLIKPQPEEVIIGEEFG